MFKKVKNGKLPIAQTKFSAGYDCFARESVVIEPNQIQKIPLGFRIDSSKIETSLKMQLYIQLSLRSSLASRGLIIPNGVGIIDIDYEDEISLLVYNTNKKVFKVKKGDRVGQILILSHYGYRIFGNYLRKQSARVGGFGSTDAVQEVVNEKQD